MAHTFTPAHRAPATPTLVSGHSDLSSNVASSKKPSLTTSSKQPGPRCYNFLPFDSPNSVTWFLAGHILPPDTHEKMRTLSVLFRSGLCSQPMGGAPQIRADFLICLGRREAGHTTVGSPAVSVFTPDAGCPAGLPLPDTHPHAAPPGTFQLALEEVHVRRTHFSHGREPRIRCLLAPLSACNRREQNQD